MNKQRTTSNIDGFVLRRRTVGPAVAPIAANEKLPVPQQFLEADADESQLDKRPSAPHVGEAGTFVGGGSTFKSDIDESLRSIDDEPVKKPRRRINKKIVKRIVLLLIVIAIAVGGYLGFKVMFASGSIFKGNIFSVFTNKALKKDSHGRSNILLFGTSEDDPAHIENGSGTELTDSIMVVSVDQEKKDAVMFSIPRDLWIDYGQACFSGYAGKINAVYSCAKQGATEQAGAEKLASTVGKTFGLDIQYYAKVNYTALKDAVNAVGGITVTVDSDDPRGIYDPNFDWMCGYRCKMVKYANGPVTLDGEHALALARARNAAGGYGLDRGNFDREQYQQKIMIAIKEKAVSAGTVANPVAVSNLIDSLGNNIRTNFETSEIKTLVELVGGIKKENIRSISLISEDKPLVTNGSYASQSIVRPVAGIQDFSQIQSFIQAQMSSGSSSNAEDASIEILNGSDTSGVAGKKQAELASKGIVVTSVGDTPTQSSFGALQWYDLTGGSKPETAKKLTSALGKGSSGSTLPQGVQSDANFVIIIGNGAN